MKLASVILCMIILFSGCSTPTEVTQGEHDSIPLWYYQGEIVGYDREVYLLGFGSGITKEDALAAAQGEIGSQIKVSVETTVESFRKETMIDGQFDYFETFLDQSTISSSETLTGSQIIKQEHIAGTWYVATALHKGRFLSQMQLTLQDLQSQIAQQIQQARTAASQAEVLTALELYRKAFNTLISSYTIRSYVEAIGKVSIPIQSPDIASEVQALLGSIEISLTAGNHQEVLRGSLLPQQLIFHVSAHNLPVSGIPVTVRSADGSVIDRFTTRSDGSISVPIRAVASEQIRATIDLSVLMKPFTGNIGRPEATASYSVIDTADRGELSLSLYDTQGHRMEALERSIIGHLQLLGITVSNTAEWEINGTCTVTAQHEISSYQGPQYTATVDLLIVLTDEQGKQRDHLTLSRTRKSAESALAAIDAAEKSFSITTDQLATLLEVF